MDEKYEPPVLTYDSECSLCVRFKKSLERIPGHEAITIISIHDPKLYEQFSFLTKEQCSSDIHLILSEEKILVGDSALRYLIHLFPKVKSFSWLIDSTAGQKAVSYFYKIAGSYRHSLRKCCSDCRKVK